MDPMISTFRSSTKSSVDRFDQTFMCADSAVETGKIPESKRWEFLRLVRF